MPEQPHDRIIEVSIVETITHTTHLLVKSDQPITDELLKNKNNLDDLTRLGLELGTETDGGVTDVSFEIIAPALAYRFVHSVDGDIDLDEPSW